MTQPVPPAVLEVNECRVFAYGRGEGVGWWREWRHRMESAGRITIVKATLGGDLVRVACDSRDDAGQLRDHMISFAGVPSTALKVRRP